jgi:hypothetical protein
LEARLQLMPQDVRALGPDELVQFERECRIFMDRNGTKFDWWRKTTADVKSRCAVTGELFPLRDLKYWSVERQETYKGAIESLRAHYPEKDR